MSFFRSVGAQLSLALLLVVAIALGVVYLTVVPSLRDRAVSTHVAEWRRSPPACARRSADGAADRRVGRVASEEHPGVRVALLNQLAPSGPVVPQRDSARSRRDLQGDPVATRALAAASARTGR